MRTRTRGERLVSHHSSGTITGTATDSYTVDGAGPTTTIAARQGPTTERSLAVAWGATDAASSVTGYDVDASIDGGPWTRWLTGTAQTEATYPGSVGHRYRFRVRATDSLGNMSGWVESTEASVVAQPTPPPPPPAGGGPVQPITPPTSPKATAKVTVARVRRTRAGVVVEGRIHSRATGGVTVTYTTKVGRKTYRSRRYGRIRKGRFKVALKLPAKARKRTRGKVQIKYRGDSRFEPQRVTRGVRSK